MNGDDDAKRSGKRLPDQPAKTQRTKGPVSFPSTVSLASLCEEGATASSNLDLLASCSSVQGSEDCDCEGHQPESERRLKRPRQAPWAAEPANQRRPPFDHSNSESIPPAGVQSQGTSASNGTDSSERKSTEATWSRQSVDCSTAEKLAGNLCANQVSAERSGQFYTKVNELLHDLHKERVSRQCRSPHES